MADTDRIRGDLEAFQAIADEHDGVRFAGTAGYEASVDHAAEVLREVGFSVATPEVAFIGFRERPGAFLEVGGQRFGAPDELRALIYSASGDVRARVRQLEESGCESDHFAEIDEGEIVLTVGSGCFRRQQALNADQAGAAALIVGYPDRGPGDIFRPTLIDPGGIEIPVISVTSEAVEALRAAEGQVVHLNVETEREPATLRNVTAACEAWFADRGEPSEPVDLGGSSDHFAFMEVGIPTGGLFAGATASGSAAQPGAGGGDLEPFDACYHLACDDLDNVDLERVALFAEACFAVTDVLLADR